MCDEWMQSVQIALTTEQFQRLPRNSAFRYLYHQAQVWITPQPRFYHALLDLASTQEKPGERANGEVVLRALSPSDWTTLPKLFAQAFRGTQPFAGLNLDTLHQASQHCLAQTQAGRDGPVIESSSQLTFFAGSENPVGACVITLLPAGDPTDQTSYTWQEVPPSNAVANCLGRPHLTWIVVDPTFAGRGIGTTLLQAACQQLRELGYRELASTFLLGNDASMLWHWRNGFRLLPSPYNSGTKVGQAFQPDASSKSG
jgi:hypothetical protein